MKTKTLSILLSMLCPVICFAQDFSVARNHITEESNRTNYFEGINLTTRGLNLFLAKKSIRYLATDADVSLYKSFFIADIGDGELTLGRNIAFKQPQTDRLWGLLTPTIKAKAEDNFSEIFSSGKFNDEIVGGLKFTWFLGGKVLFYYPTDRTKLNGRYINPPAQQKYMAHQRAYNLAKVESDFEDKRDIFLQSIQSVTNALDRNSLVEDFDEEENNKALESWYEAEVESFDSEKAHNAVVSWWISFWGNYTLVGSDLNIRDTPFGENKEVNFKGYDLNLQGTYMRDGRGGLFYGSLGGGLVFQNSIKTKQGIKKYDEDDYLQNQKPDTLQLISVNDNEIYVGTYDEFTSSKVMGQLVWFFPEFKIGEKIIWDKNFGLSMKFEKWMGTYDPFNLTLGVPLILSGKDADKKLNLEIQFKWIDLSKNIEGLTKDDRFSAGVNLSIPFSSLIY